MLFRSLIEERDGQSVLMCVPKAMIKERFDYAIPRLIERMKVDPTNAFVDVARLFEINWNDLRSYDWFYYDYKTGKLFQVGGSAPMVCKLTDDTEEKNDGSKVFCSIYSEEFATRDMSFVSAKADWSHFLEKNMNCFGIWSFEAQDLY